MGKSIKNPFMNLVLLQGRLTKDPELTYTHQGTAISKFGVAVEEYTKATKIVKVHYFDCYAAGKTAEMITEQNIGKGYDIQVSGKLQHETWENKAGVKCSTVKVFATRVFSMTWPEDGHAPAPRKQEQQDHETISGEDDMPFCGMP